MNKEYDDSYENATSKYMDELYSAPEREPEVEGITQQGHDSLVKFMAICLVLGLVIGSVVVLFMN